MSGIGPCPNCKKNFDWSIPNSGGSQVCPHCNITLTGPYAEWDWDSNKKFPITDENGYTIGSGSIVHMDKDGWTYHGEINRDYLNKLIEPILISFSFGIDYKKENDCGFLRHNWIKFIISPYIGIEGKPFKKECSKCGKVKHIKRKSHKYSGLKRPYRKNKK